MTTAGIDLGAKFIKVLFLKDNEVLARTQERAGFEPAEAAKRAFAAALSESGLTENDLDAICATGAGPEELLVGWLNEILFAFDAQGLAPTRAVVDSVTDEEVCGRLFGQDFDPLHHDVRNVVKAVTFHDLSVKRMGDLLEVTIVFDV